MEEIPLPTNALLVFSSMNAKGLRLRSVRKVRRLTETISVDTLSPNGYAELPRYGPFPVPLDRFDQFPDN